MTFSRHSLMMFDERKKSHKSIVRKTGNSLSKLLLDSSL